MNIPELIAAQKKFFRTGSSLELSFRLENLGKLRKLISDNHERLCDAIQSDLGKPRFEAYTGEIATVLHEIDLHRRNLKNWAGPQTVKGALMTIPSTSKIYFEPYGTVLIIGTWNYPILLIFQPLIGAVSAGNTIVIKPSERASATSALIANVINEAFDPDYVRVVRGGVKTNQELISEKFDYIFFTGSTRVGKIVMKAAAEHLTPVTLELGGKSPAVIHNDADIETSTRRVWWGKCLNSGQICVAPDYVVVHKDLAEEFVSHSQKVLASFYSNNEPGASPDTRIIDQDHFDRLTGLLSGTDPVLGGRTDRDKLYIEPTLVRADWDHPLMKDEIFGPILPLLVYDDLSDLIQRLKGMPVSLALYLFTNSNEVKERVIRQVPFGGGCVNETISHYVNSSLPFGGKGHSGIGSYHGKYSFETFSHRKSILEKPNWPDPDFRYPPYTDRKLNISKKIFS